MTDVDQEVSTNIVQITHCISSNPTFVKTSIRLQKMATIILIVSKVKYNFDLSLCIGGYYCKSTKNNLY